MVNAEFSFARLTDRPQPYASEESALASPCSTRATRLLDNPLDGHRPRARTREFHRNLRQNPGILPRLKLAQVATNLRIPDSAQLGQKALAVRGACDQDQNPDREHDEDERRLVACMSTHSHA